MLIVVALGIAIEIKGLLIGQSADPQTVHQVTQFIESHPGVQRVLRLLTLQLGGSIMVAVKVQMEPASGADMVACINRAERAVRERFPEIQWLFFEPDVRE